MTIGKSRYAVNTQNATSVNPVANASHLGSIADMTALELLKQLAECGGAIVCAADCSPEDVALAKADTRFASFEGVGFVRKVPKAREPGQFTAQPCYSPR